MKFENEAYVKAYANNMPPLSKRSMPVYSQVGRGPKGNDAALIIEGTIPQNLKLVGRTYDWITDQAFDTAELPLMELVPHIHYQLWKGVRRIDGADRWGYYIHYSCDVTMNEHTYEFWEFTTPFTPTSLFSGGPIPDDELIDEDEPGGR